MYKYVRGYFTSFYHFCPSRKKFLKRGKITKEELGGEAGAKFEGQKMEYYDFILAGTFCETDWRDQCVL